MPGPISTNRQENGEKRYNFPGQNAIVTDDAQPSSRFDCDWPGKRRKAFVPSGALPQRGLLLWRKPFFQMRAAAGSGTIRRSCGDQRADGDRPKPIGKRVGGRGFHHLWLIVFPGLALQNIGRQVELVNCPLVRRGNREILFYLQEISKNRGSVFRRFGIRKASTGRGSACFL